MFISAVLIGRLRYYKHRARAVFTLNCGDISRERDEGFCVRHRHTVDQAAAVHDPHAAFRYQPERHRVNPVFDCENARRERLFGIVAVHSDRALRDDRAGIQFRHNKMYRRAMGFAPASSARLCVSRPLKAGSKEGWILSMRSGH